MSEFPTDCVCGGTLEAPNADCERCRMVQEIEALRGTEEILLEHLEQQQTEIERQQGIVRALREEIETLEGELANEDE